jgi:drug/metabolite transporter (DMT)-like permease
VRLTKWITEIGLLTGATVWGLIWYPYRALEHAGISGVVAATLTYAGALVLGALLFRARLQGARPSPLLVAIALSAGWANIGFTVAVVYGDVMRVVLLFYLAPVWTVLFARLLLGEQLNGRGYALMLLAFAGAITMLWRPHHGWPLPRSGAEWMALSAGVAFALSNVLARRAVGIAIPVKALAVFAGGVMVGGACLLFAMPAAPTSVPAPAQLALLVVLSMVLLSVNVAVQHGLAHVGANRAIVIYLSELVVAAFAAWLLADETLTLREWLGGAMIVAAGLLSERLAGVQAPRHASKATAGAPSS